MKKLILRNLKLRKSSLFIYLALILFSPIYYLLVDKDTLIGGIIYSILSTTILFITLFDCGNAYRLQFKLGGNKVFYFNHSLPFSSREQLNAHYLTTVIMSLAGFLVLVTYFNMPIGGKVDGLSVSSPFTFIAVNFLGHAIAFPRCSEIRRDFIPYWIFILVVNIILPIIMSILLILSAVFIQQGLNMSYDKAHDFIINYLTVFSFGFIVVCLLVFIFTYLKQIRRIKNSEQTF